MSQETKLYLKDKKDDRVLLKEYSLKKNAYNTPKEHININAIGIILGRLLLLEPGTITHSPEMGIGLISKYRYMQSDKVDELSNRIKEQISLYIDQFITPTVDITFTPGENIMNIYVTMNGLSLGFIFNSDELSLKTITG